jgi:hypothetical protein
MFVPALERCNNSDGSLRAHIIQVVC